MKNTIFLMAMFCLMVNGTLKAQEVQNGAKIEFMEDEYDYGTVQENGNGTHEFKFKNTGNEPLILASAKGSCSCTVPSWPMDPIAPGETGTIVVKYDTKRVGPINKSVTIISNATNEPTKVIRIKGNVEAAVSGTPVNASGPEQH